MRGIRDGRGKTVENPFTGESTELAVPEAVLRVRELLKDFSSDRTELYSALETVLRATAASCAGGVLAAVDYESVFEDDVQIRIQDTDGNNLNHCFHEIFSEADPKRA